MSPPIYDNPSSIGDRRVRGRVSAYLRAYDFLRANRDFTIRNARMVAALLPIRGLLQITETNWTPFVLSLEHCIESQTAVSDLSRVRVPVHVVYGTLDQFIAPGSLAVVEAMRHGDDAQGRGERPHHPAAAGPGDRGGVRVKCVRFAPSPGRSDLSRVVPCSSASSEGRAARSPSSDSERGSWAVTGAT